MTEPYEIVETDLLILGSGGAGLFAALHAFDANPRLAITLVVKGLLGKSGCTRMVQGGYNAVLDPRDSLEKHFLDTLRGGQFLNDQELAWTLVAEAPRRIVELENQVGCFFDRRPDGRIHQKAFAGQSFDRTVHKGDLTGQEIVGRLTEQVYARQIRLLEEHRALELLSDRSGGRIAGAVLLDIRTGRFAVAQARATLLATGGGPTMYRITAASADKSTDGMAMAYRAGAELCDMEMVQFHPTGLLAGPSLISGTVLEEGLRGAGGYLLNGRGERFMARYDPVRMERATRDIVARSSYLEIREGRGTKHGGVLIDMSHLGPEFVERHFGGMCERCRDVGFDLARQPVEVSPTAHYMMGGARITLDGRSNREGLFVAGEDAGGVHGANRLGGNGVADSCVFGARAGDAMAAAAPGAPRSAFDEAIAAAVIAETLAALGGPGGEEIYPIRDEMRHLTWDALGLVRNARDLETALAALAALRGRAARATARGGRRYNLEWMDILNVRNQLLVSEMIARSALAREESRGSHYREDFPAANDRAWLRNVCVRRAADGDMAVFTRPVALSRLRPEEAERLAGVGAPRTADLTVPEDE
jgi:succinate dehydrogenase/fumarate reductase flavoprotein subunit